MGYGTSTRHPPGPDPDIKQPGANTLSLCPRSQKCKAMGRTKRNASFGSRTGVSPSPPRSNSQGQTLCRYAPGARNAKQWGGQKETPVSDPGTGGAAEMAFWGVSVALVVRAVSAAWLASAGGGASAARRTRRHRRGGGDGVLGGVGGTGGKGGVGGVAGLGGRWCPGMAGSSTRMPISRQVVGEGAFGHLSWSGRPSPLDPAQRVDLRNGR